MSSAAFVSKKELRRLITSRLKVLGEEETETQSLAIAQNLFGCQAYKSSKCVAVYMSMPSGEVRTNKILSQCFLDEKRVLIPKVTGKGPSDMVFVELTSWESLKQLTASPWGIPEPPLPEGAQCNPATCCASKDAAPLLPSLDEIDLVVCPLVGADLEGRRIGHGRGYYDTMLTNIIKARTQSARPRSYFAGLCFKEQIVSEIPVNDQDQRLDAVVTAHGVHDSSKKEEVTKGAE
eukprot:GHVN01106373.1.p1 GENE.GHVN01106373.1~~GHVN01106373.1.p1  ORF type:complete len:235 (+),score=29.30 GHVN01106373.1:208-912(+)